jgi:hypothetical protein
MCICLQCLQYNDTTFSAYVIIRDSSDIDNCVTIISCASSLVLFRLITLFPYGRVDGVKQETGMVLSLPHSCEDGEIGQYVVYLGQQNPGEFSGF